MQRSKFKFVWRAKKARGLRVRVDSTLHYRNTVRAVHGTTQFILMTHCLSSVINRLVKHVPVKIQKKESRREVKNHKQNVIVGFPGCEWYVATAGRTKGPCQGVMFLYGCYQVVTRHATPLT